MTRIGPGKRPRYLKMAALEILFIYGMEGLVIFHTFALTFFQSLSLLMSFQAKSNAQDGHYGYQGRNNTASGRHGRRP